MSGISRRALIKGVAATGAATYVSQSAFGRALAAGGPPAGGAKFMTFNAIAPSGADVLEVPNGFSAETLIAWGDEFGPGLEFGYNCDYTAYFPLKGASEGILWVNHEYVIPFFVSNWRKVDDPSWNPTIEPYASLMAAEKQSVGGSLVHVKRVKGRFQVVKGSPYNHRITGAGPQIPYDGPIANDPRLAPGGALGTLANCSGGQTPWGTVLSAEENYQSYGLQRFMPFNLGWDNDGDPAYYAGEVQPPPFPDPPNTKNAYGLPAVETPNYGYVVEVDPYTGQAVRHTALGRIHHENVSLRVAKDGRIVAYTGDDAPIADGMLFKFVSSGKYRRSMSRAEAMTLLADGQLYVAQFNEGANNPDLLQGTGQWRPLDMADPDALAFTTKWVRDTIVPAVGGNLGQFQVPRAEDVEIVPGRPRDVLMALTSARKTGMATSYGVVRLLREAAESPDSTSFEWFDVVSGGPASGVANPDNMAFTGDGAGLWLTSDISNSALSPNTAPFTFHGNNALYYLPLSGPNANVAFRFANAPVRAEITGPTFVGDDTLFVSVQHPGEPRNNELDLDPFDPMAYTSWWPEGNRTAGTNPAKPKPAVVTIRAQG